MADRPKTFQTRARKIKDDGGDFEDFVFECFRIAKEELGFSKRLAQGRDGAIDLIDRFGEPGAATVAECKFIGSGKAGDAKARWREVYDNLHKICRCSVQTRKRRRSLPIAPGWTRHDRSRATASA